MIYLVVFILTSLLAIRFDFFGYKKFKSLWYNIILFVFVGVAGLRYKVGGDTIGYIQFFEDIPFLSEISRYNFVTSGFDPLWVVVSSICKSIINDFGFFQFLHALFINLVIFRFFKKYTPYVFTSVLIYFLFFYVYYNMEIMRESLSVSVFLLAYPYFKERKWMKYYIAAVIAFLFHSSAIIVFLFPLLRNTKLQARYITLLVVLFVIGFSIVLFMPSVVQFILFTDRLSSRFEGYSELTANINGMIFNFFVYAVVPYLIIRYYKSFSNNAHAFEELHVLYFGLVMLFVSISGFGRFLNYVAPFMMVYFANFLNDIFRNTKIYYKVRGQLVVLVLLIVLLPKIQYYTSSTSHLVAGTRKYNLYIPYHTIFSEEEYREREVIWRENFNYRREQREN